MPLIPSRFVNTKWRFLNDQDLIVTNARCENPSTYTPEFAVRAGPRIETVFEPSQCRAAIVTCGGLCPGKIDDGPNNPIAGHKDKNAQV